MRATVVETIKQIKQGDYEEYQSCKVNNKNRNCVFCSKNIKAKEEFVKHFEYPYEENQKRWFACMKCFKEIKSETKGEKK